VDGDTSLLLQGDREAFDRLPARVDEPRRLLGQGEQADARLQALELLLLRVVVVGFELRVRAGRDEELPLVLEHAQPAAHLAERAALVRIDEVRAVPAVADHQHPKVVRGRQLAFRALPQPHQVDRG